MYFFAISPKTLKNAIISESKRLMKKIYETWNFKIIMKTLSNISCKASMWILF